MRKHYCILCNWVIYSKGLCANCDLIRQFIILNGLLPLMKFINNNGILNKEYYNHIYDKI